jgi:hypothetical protein
LTRSGGKPEEEAPAAPFSRAELQAIVAATHQAPKPAESEARLRVVPVSPWRVHVLWSVPEEQWRTAQAALPHGHDVAPVLRFFDLTPMSASAPRPHPPFDVAVTGAANGWFVDVWKDGKTYVAEFGLRSGDRFVTLARSQPVEMPVAGPSPDIGADWAPVLRPDPGPPPAAPVSPRPPIDLTLPLFPARPPPSDLPAVADVPDGHPGFPEIQPEDAASVAAGRAEAAALAAAGLDAETGAFADGPVPPFDDFAPSSDAYRPPSDPVLSPDNIVTLSSFALGQTADLEINAELLIHGRARPGSVLSLFGRPVTVAPDGTFSVRRPLPHGALLLPLVLTLGDGGDGDGGGA